MGGSGLTSVSAGGSGGSGGLSAWSTGSSGRTGSTGHTAESSGLNAGSASCCYIMCQRVSRPYLGIRGVIRIRKQEWGT